MLVATRTIHLNRETERIAIGGTRRCLTFDILDLYAASGMSKWRHLEGNCVHSFRALQIWDAPVSHETAGVNEIIL